MPETKKQAIRRVVLEHDASRAHDQHEDLVIALVVREGDRLIGFLSDDELSGLSRDTQTLLGGIESEWVRRRA